MRTRPSTGSSLKYTRKHILQLPESTCLRILGIIGAPQYKKARPGVVCCLNGAEIITQGGFHGNGVLEEASSEGGNRIEALRHLVLNLIEHKRVVVDPFNTDSGRREIYWNSGSFHEKKKPRRIV